jgi:hypothetical protein
VTNPGDERRYLRAVEDAWARLRARPTVLSPRDFEIVDGWRRRGISLGVVLEVLDHQAKRKTSGGRRSLAYLSTAVEEAWAAVSGGRSATAVSPPPRDPSAGETWRSAASRTTAGTPLHALLLRLQADAENGTAASELDRRLDAALPSVAPPEIVARAERETAAALASFRSRMREEEFAKTLSRARADRLRAALSLPRSTSTG